MTVTFVRADTVDFNAYSATLNAAYADYFVPLDMSPSQLRARIQQDSVNLHSSVAVVDDGEVVGLAMLGQRGKNGWIGGVGLLPAYRGHGHGRKLMHTILDYARQLKLARVQLECITENHPAYALYQSLGFQTLRRLHVVEGSPLDIPTLSSAHPVRATVDEVLSLYHLHPTENPWQRQHESLSALSSQLQAYVMRGGDGKITAFALGVFNSYVIRLVDLGCIGNHNNDLLQLLLHLHTKYPHALGSMINVAEDDRAWPMLQSLNYMPYLSQYEMVLTL